MDWLEWLGDLRLKADLHQGSFTAMTESFDYWREVYCGR